MIGEFLSLLSIGIGLGAIYGLGAVGLALIVRFTGILHFAHGAVFIVASYIMLTVAGSAALGWTVPAALVASAIGGLVVYELIYRPMERRRLPALGFVIASFGVLIVVENAMTLAFGSTALDVAWPSAVASQTIHVGAATIRVADLVSLAVAAATIGGLAWYRRHTRTGLLLRALERNKTLAADLGISYRRYAPVVFIIGSLLGGVSAVLSSFTTPVASTGGLDWTVSVYIAMAVGGAGSVWGAAVGGMILGILSTVPDLWIAGSWNTALAFGVLVVLLIVMPNGLLPERSRKQEHPRFTRPVRRASTPAGPKSSLDRTGINEQIRAGQRQPD